MLCDRLFYGVVRHAMGFNHFFDRAIQSTHPVEKGGLFDGMGGSDWSIEKAGIEKALFQQYKKAPYCLRSEPRFSIHVSDRGRIGLSKDEPLYTFIHLRSCWSVLLAPLFSVVSFSRSVLLSFLLAFDERSVFSSTFIEMSSLRKARSRSCDHFFALVQ